MDDAGRPPQDGLSHALASSEEYHSQPLYVQKPQHGDIVWPRECGVQGPPAQ